MRGVCVCVSVAQSTLFIRDPVNLLGTLAPKATVRAAAQVLPPSWLPFLGPTKSVGSPTVGGDGGAGHPERAAPEGGVLCLGQKEPGLKQPGRGDLSGQNAHIHGKGYIKRHAAC